ncbi:MAG: alpha/beta hydrolase [Labilithrix sp.]|nr:alpha/beta hydrolase [Labilithrix sp.]MCW5811240.1 alpha/beta hydrolase [Labilithrix sp.]
MSRFEKRTSGPIIFGDPDAQLFGWYHAPAKPAKVAGVVLCNPFGYEAMCLHRVYRTLAERLAASGIAALRFDYHGTGDSAGSDHDPDRVASWRRSAGAAIDELRRRAGVRDVSLFGIRWGATMAYLTALDRGDVASLVLWSPYLTGRAFLREMRMMQTAGAEQAFASGEDRGVSPLVKESPRNLRALPDEPPDEEAVGYLLSTGTVTELGKIDLRAKKESPAARVLLLGRDDFPDDGRLTKHLHAMGSDVTDLTSVPGYAAMMQDAYLSKVPREAFDQVVAWLGRVVHTEYEEEEEEERATLLDLTREGPHLVADSVAREEAIMFGPTGKLIGVLCEPAARGPARTRDAVLFLNVGSNHRVGSNRMYVKMARTFAARGVTTFRFDVSGIGDSAASADFENRLYAPEAVADTQEAMTKLTSLREVERFYLVGLCSGSYLAYKTAVVDPRVAGQILVNTQTFDWKPGDTLEVSIRKNYRSTRFYTQEMWNPQTWKRVIRGEVNARGIASTLAERAVARAVKGAKGTIARVRTGRLEVDDVVADFKTILKRGTETLMIFGANDGGLDLMESHFGSGAKKLASYRGFHLEIIEGSDHTFTPLWSQTWLEKLVVSSIERWRGQPS